MLPNNSLHLGDCLEVMKGIDDKSIDLVLTDIPYNVVNRKDHGLRSLDKEQADVLTFDIPEFLAAVNRVCKGSIYIFCSTEQVSEIRKTLVDFNLTTRHCIWEKTNPSPMNGQYIWLSSIENCVFARNKKSVFNEKCKSSVWRFPNGRNKQHPTEKSLALFEYLVSVSSNQNDLVLDPCLGSGTTCVAAKRLNRRFIGIEKNEDYFKICQHRCL